MCVSISITMKKNIFKRKSSIVLIIAVLLVGLVAVMLIIERKPDLLPEPDKVAENIWYSKLDGTIVPSQADQNPTVVGVMIDNHPAARPQQSGLSQARVVYEALAEGGITRYMAVFSAKDTVTKAGPVRSARPYYLDWIREYGNSTYWHSGGSPEALSIIKKLSLASTNEFINGQYYWRDHKYFAPHNLFTKSDFWTAYLNSHNKMSPEEWEGWIFEDINSVTTTTIKGMNIKYSYDYSVTWKYDGEKYLRSINNKQQKDGEKDIYADTVIVEVVPTRIIDDVGRKDLETVGQGAVKVFNNGIVIKGYWKKASPTARTKFYAENGDEIKLNRGKVWVQVVPLDTALEIIS